MTAPALPPCARRLLSLTGIAAALLAAPATAAAAPTLVPVGTFASPMYVTAPAGDAARLYVVERAGRVREVVDGVVQPAPFLDVSALTTTDGERGLLSMAFAPDYAATHLLYVCFTDTSGNIHVEELRAASADAVDPASRRTLFVVPHSSQSNHNGGQLQFGPDGMLYLSVGDGGGAGDPNANAQNLGVLLGKLLRIDPHPTATTAYGIPPDNPFVGQAGARAEIYAYGLRNPWRWSFDRATGAITIGDVGQSTREEVDFAPAGGARGVNYGWRCWEGTFHFDTACDPANDVPPVLEYGHVGGACSITGGFVVRDASLPSLAGRYVYGDFCTGQLRAATLAPGSSSGDAALGLQVSQLNSFGEDACGRIYTVSLAGAVSRLQDTSVASSCTPAQAGTAGGAPGGTTSTPATLVAPVASIGHALRRGLAVGARSVPVTVRWSAAKGAASYTLQRSLDGGRFATVSRSLHATSVDVALTAGHRYRFRVRAVTATGDVAAWRTDTAFVVQRIGLRATTGSARSLRVAFRARDVAWIAPARVRASVRVYVDGHLVATVHAARRAAMAWTAHLARGSHVVQIVGPATRASGNGFVFLR